MATARHPKAASFVQQKLFANLSAFAELEQRIANLPDEKSRGDAFEVFAEAYLATQRKYDAAQVWPHDSVPLDILKNLGLSQQDRGVDGVLQTLLGQFDAYQVKFRTGRPSLTWRELSTFFGLTDSARIHSRVVFTNCDEFPDDLKDRRGFFCIRGSDLDRLEATDFRAIEAWLADAVFIAPKKSPDKDHIHQAEALNALVSALQTQPRVSAIMACGTGKTLVALWVAERLEAKRILVLLPSLALLRQTLHEWVRETNLPPWPWLCVCSDLTVKEGIDPLVTQQSDLDFQVTTDAASVRSFLDAPFAGVKMIFSTYQSASVVGAAMKPGEAFDFAVFDEAHKTAGREGRNFAFALEDKNLPIRKRLFLTATPRHYNPLAKDEEGEAQLVFSMDRPDVYGTQAYCLTFAEAARRGIICGYKVIISVITSEMVTNELLNRGEVIVNGDVVRARQVANQLALKDVVVKYNLNKVFTFHSRIEAAASFTSNGNDGICIHLPEFKAFHVNGEMPTGLRERVMTEFRACARGVMSNARCLTEGVDVPAVDMVAFMSPRRSKIDIVQATGRAMRNAPGKTTGFVLVPLYVEQVSGEKVEQAIERTEFDEVWQVLQSLQEQDNVLAETISRMREDRGRGGVFDEAAFGDYIDILGPKICLDILRAAITTKCVDTLGNTWDERYGQLKAYHELTGHCLVGEPTASFTPRASKIYHELTGDHLGSEDDSSLHDLQDWIASQPLAQSVDFSRTLRLLREWVKLQRRMKLSGALSEERIRKLNEIGFVWGTEQKVEVVIQPPESPATVSHRVWEEMFNRLVAFKEEYGDCDVPRDYFDIDKLAWWVVCQRKLRLDENLGGELVRRLDGVGFVWNRKEYLWDKMYSVVCQILNSGGVSGLESALQGDNELSKWVRSQQAARKRGVLTARKQRALNNAGFPWVFPKKPKAPTKPSWDSFFVRLVEFQKQHGHCDMKLVLPLDEHLHKWAQEQRQARQTRTTTPDQISQLDQIGFIWNTDDLLWERMLKALITYKSVHGDCNVPRYSQQNYQLAIWVASQRTRRKSGELKPNQIERLNTIGFDWERS